MKTIGLDYGLARIGIAVSDEKNVIAFPYQTLKCLHTHEKTVEELLKILALIPYKEIVIGLPLLMSGKESEMSLKVREFAKMLEKETQKKVTLWDERLTSKEVEKRMIEGDLKRKKRTQFVDQLAAAVILQNFLDTKNIY
jgi:putative Holliday junction resolvase